MAVPKHLEEAVGRLEAAASRIDVAQKVPVTLENLREWVVGQTEYAKALSDIHQYNNESLCEKIHQLAAVSVSGSFHRVARGLEPNATRIDSFVTSFPLLCEGACLNHQECVASNGRRG